jgi:hypothetical protein
MAAAAAAAAAVCPACREGGKPLLVSLLVYLDKEWPLGHDAETLFLDTPTDTGELHGLASFILLM